MGDARAQQWENSSNAYVSTWRHRWLNEGDEKELRERWNKLRAKDHARYNDRKAKAAKGDEKAQAAIQHYNDLNRYSYHARRQRAAEGDEEARAQLDKELKNKRMRVDRRNRALIESGQRSEKCNSASRLETQRLLRSEDLLADILFERARCRRKVKLEIRQPFEDQVNISEMALKSPESLIAIAEVSKEGIDRNVYRQWLLHIRDINLLCLLNLLDLKTWMKGMGGGGWGVNCSIRTLLQEAESVLLAEGVEEAKWSLTKALEVLRQRFPDRRNVKKWERQT